MHSKIELVELSMLSGLAADQHLSGDTDIALLSWLAAPTPAAKTPGDKTTSTEVSLGSLAILESGLKSWVCGMMDDNEPVQVLTNHA